MNFIKRAWLATKAKKGRTALLTLVTSAILIFVLAGLSIKNAADTAVENAKSQTGATVTLQVSREAMMKNMKPSDDSTSSSSSDTTTIRSVDLATATAIAKKDGVSSYLFTSTTSVTAGDNITPISTSSTSSDTNSSSSSEAGDNSQAPSDMPSGRMGGDRQMVSGDFTITGVNSTEQATNFTFGTSSITSGVGITSDTKDNEAVISADLAEANDLKVGDKITVTATVDSTEKTYTLTIVGIYENTSTATTAQMMSNASNPQNNIYTNIATANTMKGETDVLDSAVYTLSDPENVDAFVSEVESEIDTTSYSVTSSDEIYERMLSPLNTISSIAQNIVILVAIAGAVILTLIVILSIRERRYEIGVLMSLGESRLKIIGQFFTELFLVTLVSLVIATVAGNFVGNALGNQLLSSTTSQQTQMQGGPRGDAAPNQDSDSDSKQAPTNQPSDRPNGGGMGGMMQMVSSSKAIEDMDIKLTGGEVAKLGGIALLISLVSTILASIGIVRMKPKDILSSN